MATRIAAGVVCITGFVLLLFWVFPGATPNSIAFANVQKKMSETHSVSYLQQNMVDGKVTVEGRITVQKSGGAERAIVDLVKYQLVSGYDDVFRLQVVFTQKKYMLVYPYIKIVQSVTFDESAKDKMKNGPDLVDFYQSIRKLSKQAIRKLPPTKVKGKELLGFVVKPDSDSAIFAFTLNFKSDEPDNESIPETPPPKKEAEKSLELHFWIDPDTMLPVRIDIVEIMKENGKKRNQIITQLTDIQFDLPLDESLFSMKIPEGYREVNSEELKYSLGEALEKRDREREIFPDDVDVRLTEGIGRARYGMSEEEVKNVLYGTDYSMLVDDVNGHVGSFLRSPHFESLKLKPAAMAEFNKRKSGLILGYLGRGLVLHIPDTGGMNYIKFRAIRDDDDKSTFEEFQGKTSEGIGLGSSLKEVMAAYKPDYVVKEKLGDDTIHRIEFGREGVNKNVHVRILLTNEKLTEMEIFAYERDLKVRDKK